MKKVLAVLLSIGAMVLSGIPVSANTYNACPQNDCHDVLINTQSGTTTGVWMQTHNVSVNPGDSLHMNNAIWLNLNPNDCCNNFLLEIGQDAYTYGPGNVAFTYYVAIGTTLVWSRSASMDGSQHTFSIQLSSDGTKWLFYIDGQSPAVWSYTSSYHSAPLNTLETGGEIQTNSNGLDSSMTANTFSNYVQYHDSSGWHPWATYTYHTDDGCGQPGIGTTNCMNAQIPSWSVWNWNKVG